jgi:hypothetical protein
MCFLCLESRAANIDSSLSLKKTGGQEEIQVVWRQFLIFPTNSPAVKEDGREACDRRPSQ